MSTPAEKLSVRAFIFVSTHGGARRRRAELPPDMWIVEAVSLAERRVEWDALSTRTNSLLLLGDDDAGGLPDVAARLRAVVAEADERIAAKAARDEKRRAAEEARREAEAARQAALEARCKAEEDARAAEKARLATPVRYRGRDAMRKAVQEPLYLGISEWFDDLAGSSETRGEFERRFRDAARCKMSDIPIEVRLLIGASGAGPDVNVFAAMVLEP